MAYSRSENTLSSVSSPLSQIPQALIMWKAAIYIRLSKDDGDKQESNSVTNQREILKEHLKLHPDMHRPRGLKTHCSLRMTVTQEQILIVPASCE